TAVYSVSRSLFKSGRPPPARAPAIKEGFPNPINPQSAIRNPQSEDPRTSISGHHREHSQNRLAEAVIADDFDSRRSFFLRQSFCQQTPCRVLIHTNFAMGAPGGAFIKLPLSAHAMQRPH